MKPVGLIHEDSLKLLKGQVIIVYVSPLQELNVMDDTVLEDHTENPALVQMVFLDDGKSLILS